MDVDRLASIAQQFAGRLRDDDPEANRRWLWSVTTQEERDALHFVMAAAIPVDVPWRQLTAWADLTPPEDPKVIEARRRVLIEATRRVPRGRGHRAPKVA